MDERFALAGKGLWFLFLSVILNMVGSAVGIIPLVGGAADTVLSVAAFALMLYGHWVAREAHPSFLKAFYATVGTVILDVLNWFVPEESVPALIVGIVAVVVSLLKVYCILSASGELLREKGDQPLADRADLIWKLTVGCSVVMLAFMLVVWVPVLNILAGVATIVAVLGMLVAMILEIVFYYQAANSLKAA